MPNPPLPTPGILTGISVGPGDPELITLKGQRLLETAPVVALPAGVGEKPGIAEQIVAGCLTPESLKLPLSFPYVRDEKTLTRAWEFAAERVWEFLQTGKDVAFVCEGDVSFYSTFTYLAQTLQKNHPEVIVETIPGVSSPMAAVAALGIPLTIRDQKLAVIPVLYNVKELESALNWADVVVLMKVSSVYQQVWEILKQKNLLDRSYVVERATLPTQTTYKDLRDRPHLKLSYFSLMIIKTVRSNRFSDCS